MKQIYHHFKANGIIGLCFVFGLPSLAYIIKNYFLGNHPGEFGIILGSLITLLVGLYGIFWFWPNYLQQKRLENLIYTTKEALGGILETEEKIKRLFFVSNAQHANLDEQIKAQFELSYAITRMENAILLVERDSDLVRNGSIRNALAHVSTLKELLLNKNSLMAFANADLFTPQDLSNKSSMIAQLIDQIKVSILNIYDLN